MTPVIFSEKAENDLEQIGDFIAQDSPARALSFIRDLRESCRIRAAVSFYSECAQLARPDEGKA